ncbi:MAG: hypothetical protein OXH47_00070 [Paracoccaceae bacterium]|nr:hypothetical protein [Paracoccaceae bacterium]
MPRTGIRPWKPIRVHADPELLRQLAALGNKWWEIGKCLTGTTDKMAASPRQDGNVSGAAAGTAYQGQQEMLIRFLPHGRGSGQKAANYLLGKRDHRGTSREEIRILVGNPEADARLIDNLTFRNRYSSGVIAWAPEDRPTDEQVMAVLDDFEKVAFAGLQDNQCTWSAVLHRERGGGVHVHVVVPMVELRSGKSFNVAPRSQSGGGNAQFPSWMGKAR